MNPLPTVARSVPNRHAAFGGFDVAPVRIEYSATSDDGVYAGKTKRFSRSDAALELKWLRARGAYIERRSTGFYVEEKV